MAAKVCLVARLDWKSLDASQDAQVIALIVMAQGFGDALLD